MDNLLLQKPAVTLVERGRRSDSPHRWFIRESESYCLTCFAKNRDEALLIWAYHLRHGGGGRGSGYIDKNISSKILRRRVPEMVRAMAAAGVQKTEIARQLGVSRASVYRVLDAGA